MNQSEFEQQVPELRRRIVGMVSGMSSQANRELADDVAQDTLMRLWCMRDKLDEYRSLESLAIVIARNRAIDLLRGRSLPSGDIEEIDATQSEPSPEQELILSEQASEVIKIVSKLPSRQQLVVRMRHIDGLEVAEIAKITGASQVAIRVCLSRARQNIKDIFMRNQI